MTAPSRKRRGSATQNDVAAWFRDHGWPHAESAGAGRPGVDILGMAGVSVEVKARRAFSPLAWIRQARQQPGLPFVVFRCDGQGPATVADWPVLLRLEDLTGLLRGAGYGDGGEMPKITELTPEPRHGHSEDPRNATAALTGPAIGNGGEA